MGLSVVVDDGDAEGAVEGMEELVALALGMEELVALNAKLNVVVALEAEVEVSSANVV